jgi:hypothetical protein
MSPEHVAQRERQANLYLTTLESYPQAMDERLDRVAVLGDTQVTLTLADLFPPPDPVALPEPTPAG